MLRGVFPLYIFRIHSFSVDQSKDFGVVDEWAVLISLPLWCHNRGIWCFQWQLIGGQRTGLVIGIDRSRSDVPLKCSACSVGAAVKSCQLNRACVRSLMPPSVCVKVCFIARIGLDAEEYKSIVKKKNNNHFKICICTLICSTKPWDVFYIARS